MPRPRKRRIVEEPPVVDCFHPLGANLGRCKAITLPMDGLEALRLRDLLGLNHEAAARHMNVSRQTFGRILAHARRTVAHALVNGWRLEITEGDCIILGGKGEGRRARRRHRGRL